MTKICFNLRSGADESDPVQESTPSGQIHLQFWSINPPLLHTIELLQWAENVKKIVC